ncbi:universal stress protein [Natronococcus occultus]|uniref:Universal stress protein UspA-like protein n=1 Tax=Natronococcus occultus SP4 TaxID=694430 RepID=L0JW02_9EURY|nr:universal stress protein [Natronococcus occultus]AGB36941.1 universal stress protein UspA-like protein [Natronococcus occultus SP4]
MYDSILVATDGSEAASVAVEHAIDLASGLGATLYGVAVVETRTEYDNAIVDPDEAEDHLCERAEATLASLEERAAGADVPVETAVRVGVPHDEIVTYADDCGVDAIVVGARGRSSFKGALLGSTVDAVVRLATRPVLVVGDR